MYIKPSIARQTLVITAALLCLNSCSNSPLVDMTRCTEPRPQICTMQYDPVCAERADGSITTHASDCSACGKADVVGYVKGACPE